ncbi:MAG: glycosyltransferase family 9 protein [Desulfobacterales bacterium]|nr:glycosyltransferase family 9 protein [Desulfobacterales bacterium]
MKILIIKLGALGDVINTFPLVIQLKKHFQAQIHWLVEPLSYPLVSAHSCVDHAILFNKYNWKKEIAQVIGQLRLQSYDMVLDLQRILKSGLFGMLSRSNRKIGFDRRRCKEMTWILPYERIHPGPTHSHMLDQYLEFATHLGIPIDTIEWKIPIPDTPLPVEFPKNPFVVLNIGATKKANRWPIDHFANLTDRIQSRFGLSVVITGGKEDQPIVDKIVALTHLHPYNLAGKTSLFALISVFNAAQLVISCDTGPMHLAVALGKPVIALFGPSNPKRTGPYRGTVLQKTELTCVPCGKRTCDHSVCMERITPEEVEEQMITFQITN